MRKEARGNVAKAKVRRAIVVGCGEFGLAVADTLSSAGASVTVVDRAPDAFTGLAASFGGDTVVGDGADVSLLEDCGIARATLFMACTDRDSVNYFLARVAAEVYGVERVFARIEDADLIAMLDDTTVEPICPHALCLGEFCRVAKIA